MNPILFPSTATDFSTNGIGRLNPVSCVVTEERNGQYELKVVVAVSSQYASDITYRSIICAPPAPGQDLQPFRVYRIVSNIGGTISVYAQHLSYDLSGIIVMPLEASNVAEVMSKIKTYSSTENPYTFWTDLATTFDFKMPTPVSVRSILGSVVEAVGGELEWDGYTVKLHGARGTNRGMTIRYGKNMTDFQQDANCAEVYTGIYPYYYDSSGNYVEVDGCTVSAAGTYSYSKILPVDLTDQFTILSEGETPSTDTEVAYGEIPTKDQLLKVAQTYLEENNIGVPSVSMKVDFAKLSQSEEYKDLSLVEEVNLCDTVTVIFPQMGVSAQAEAVSVEYNVLTERYDSITLGDAQANFATQQATAIAQAKEELQARIDETKTALQQSQDEATKKITGNLGGYVVLHDSNDDGYPDEILILPEESQGKLENAATTGNVWRWNMGGLGFSSTGYNGSFTTAITADGKIVADFITTGTLNAALATIINLDASSITSGTIDASKITVKNLNADNITSGSISAGMIESGAISGYSVYIDLDDNYANFGNVLKIVNGFIYSRSYGTADNTVYGAYYRGYYGKIYGATMSCIFRNGICIGESSDDFVTL